MSRMLPDQSAQSRAWSNFENERPRVSQKTSQAIRKTHGAPHVIAPVVRIDCLRSEEHTSELQSRLHLVCRLLLEKKKYVVHLEEQFTWTFRTFQRDSIGMDA